MLTIFSANDRSDRREGQGQEPGEGTSGSARYSTKGSYGLKKCHEGQDPVADIVFLHGLTGNRETTWTDKGTGVFWPAHLLPIDVPNTRIVTFGYDADVVHFWGAASQNQVRNHALNLINALAQLRERSETEQRPLIFVVHSLGGLIFEDAMLASMNSAEMHIQSIYTSTAGVCFLGTPHCGSTLAKWAKIFGQIARVLKKTNISILRVLEPESEVLARIQGDFHTMMRNQSNQGRPTLKITCFYEELPVPGAGEIVQKHSAILPAYNSIGIHNNHIDMAKFSSSEDPGYLSVSTEVLRWVREIQKGKRPTVQSPVLGRTQSPAFGSSAIGRGTPESNAVGDPGLDGPAQSVPPRIEFSHGGNIISGNIHNYGDGNSVIGNEFQGHTFNF